MDDLPLTMTVPDFGRRVYGLGYYAAYEGAKRGEFPTIKVGRFLRVPVRVALRPLLTDADRDGGKLDAIIAGLCKSQKSKSAA